MAEMQESVRVPDGEARRVACRAYKELLDRCPEGTESMPPELVRGAIVTVFDERGRHHPIGISDDTAAPVKDRYLDGIDKILRVRKRFPDAKLVLKGPESDTDA